MQKNEDAIHGYISSIKKTMEQRSTELSQTRFIYKTAVKEYQEAAATLRRGMQYPGLTETEQYQALVTATLDNMDRLVTAGMSMIEAAQLFGQMEGSANTLTELNRLIEAAERGEETVAHIPIPGLSIDTTCIVEGCNRDRWFGDYCKRHTPDSERPRGKV